MFENLEKPTPTAIFLTSFAVAIVLSFCGVHGQLLYWLMFAAVSVKICEIDERFLQIEKNKPIEKSDGG